MTASAYYKKALCGLLYTVAAAAAAAAAVEPIA